METEVLCRDAREDIRRNFGSTTARNAFDRGGVPLAVVDYVERLEDNFAKLLDAKIGLEEPMKYKDCHMMHHVLKSALENKGVTLNRPMAKRLAAEIRDMVQRPDQCADETVECQELDSVNSLTELVEHLIDKPITQWQYNQLKRWDEMLRNDPHREPVVLDVPETEEEKREKEKRHQIEKIMQVAGCSEARAKTMYDDGIRLVDMPYDSDA